MPVSPSADNYTLGRGIVYFDKLESTLYQGERDLGNANSVTVNVAIDTLDHFSNRSGLKAKDKKVVLQITPTISFTLDEINYENIQLVFMADMVSISQTANSTLTYTLDVSTIYNTEIGGNRYYDVGAYRNIGVYKLQYDGGAVALAARGETITGAGGATCVVLGLAAGSVIASGTMYVSTLGGTLPFIENEVITSSGTMTGVVNHPAGTTYLDAASGLLFDTTDLFVSDAATHTTTIHVKTTDFTVDTASGRIKIVSGGGLDGETADVDVEFAVQALSYKQIRAFNETSIEGRLRFVPDNPVGNEMELFIHRCDLTPEGDVGFIGDDWQALSFTGEILKDEVSNPLSPYMDIFTVDA